MHICTRICSYTLRMLTASITRSSHNLETTQMFISTSVDKYTWHIHALEYCTAVNMPDGYT